jgi:hypothetical protein
VEDLDLGAEGEHVENRDIGRVDPHPGLRPVLAPGNDVRAPADPDVGWPAEQGGEPPAARREPTVLEVLGLAEVEHNARNNRMRAC